MKTKIKIATLALIALLQTLSFCKEVLLEQNSKKSQSFL